MEIKKQHRFKLAAKISLVVVLLTIALQLIAFYQTQYQLVSPLIPESAILTIVRPFIFMAFIASLVSIAGLILYFYQMYLYVTMVCGLTIVWQQVYSYF